MKSFFRLALFFASAAFLFSSCSKKNEVGKMIPKNAMFVMELNTKSLREKITWDDIKQTSWFREAYSDSSTKDWTKKLLDNPENSGIDLNGSLIFFVSKNSATEGDIVLEGTIKSESDFGDFNKNLDSSATIKKDGDLNMLFLKDETVVAWNDKHFVYAFDAGQAMKFNPMNNSSFNQSNVAPLVDKSVTLAAVCKSVFSLKSDSSLAGSDKFTNLLKEKGDMRAWINTEEIMKSSSSLGMLGMLKLDVFFKDNISTYTVNFDNGKIDVSQKGYAGKEFSDFLQKYSGSGINTDMIKTIPSQNIFGVFALNFKPEGIKELIKLTGMDGMLNSQTSQLGFNLDDFVKANKGDITLAISDVTMPNISQGGGNSNMSMSYKPDFNILFSASIGDKQSFQKLMEAGKKIGGQMGTNSDTGIAYGQNDKLFAITNHQHFLNDYLAGNANNKFDFLDKINGHPFGLYIDLHKILTLADAAKSQVHDEDKTIMNASLKLWNNIFMTAGDFKDGAMTGNTEINFIDQSTNSLKQLNNYFDVIATAEKAKKAEQAPDMNTMDSTMMVPPPIDTVGHK